MLDHAPNSLALCFVPSWCAAGFAFHKSSMPQSELLYVHPTPHGFPYFSNTTLPTTSTTHQGDIFRASFDDSTWASPVQMTANIPWPTVPPDVETPGQTVAPCTAPTSIVAAGTVMQTVPLNVSDAYNPAQRMQNGTVQPSAATTAALRRNLTAGLPLVLTGPPGGSVYVTFAYDIPVHGYPQLHVANAMPGSVCAAAAGWLPLH